MVDLFTNGKRTVAICLYIKSLADTFSDIDKIGTNRFYGTIFGKGLETDQTMSIL